MNRGGNEHANRGRNRVWNCSGGGIALATAPTGPSSNPKTYAELMQVHQGRGLPVDAV